MIKRAGQRVESLGLRAKGLGLAVLCAATLSAQTGGGPDWKALEPEMMEQFQAVLRLDTRNPPGNEHIVAEYLKGVFDKAGIPAQIFALDANRSNVVARLKGNGKKKPILIMGHSDVVTVDDKKWKFPPSAPRVRAATSTPAARSTTRTTSPPV